jgi:hypothetical protein
VAQDAGRHAWQRQITEELAARAPGVVVVETGLPAWRPDRAPGVLATHGAGRANLEAAIDLLAGRA